MFDYKTNAATTPKLVPGHVIALSISITDHMPHNHLYTCINVVFIGFQTRKTNGVAL
jgi:hypothetical protein